MFTAVAEVTAGRVPQLEGGPDARLPLWEAVVLAGALSFSSAYVCYRARAGVYHFYALLKNA